MGRVGVLVPSTRYHRDLAKGSRQGLFRLQIVSSQSVYTYQTASEWLASISSCLSHASQLTGAISLPRRKRGVQTSCDVSNERKLNWYEEKGILISS